MTARNVHIMHLYKVRIENNDKYFPHYYKWTAAHTIQEALANIECGLVGGDKIMEIREWAREISVEERNNG